MKISAYLFPNNIPIGREFQIISTITIKDNRLVENYYQDHKTNTQTNFFLDDIKGNPIYVDEDDCEWLSPTFLRNQEELYGFSLIEKGNSTKLFLTRIKAKVDFESFKAIGRFYAKDKNGFYFGPGGKTIKEDNLKLFFDETYREELNKLNNDINNDPIANLWNSKIAVSEEKVYWNGKLTKGIHSSLKRLTHSYWADDYSVFEYNLQNLKKIEGFDRETLVYRNSINGNSINELLTDKNKPAYCYKNESEPNEKYDFKRFAPLFIKLRDTLDRDYWWYKMENNLQHQ
ncbi:MULTISPECIES: DKNYY domain-containing protein [Flavobacterium]|uniref:DKNYY domain-containing protein n=2 Tax=Flavobacterium TaxID=237 RepID=A0ABV5GM05_9FLAO|nr:MULTISPECIES: DKNYY domain-containing protein [Flavobacterium]